MTALGFIPARMDSTRYPGKPLAPIAGRPMLEHCWRGASSSTLIDEALLATCDEEIAAWARDCGIGCVMTSDRHVRATDRVVEAAATTDADAFVLIQGDEPMVTGTMVDAALAPILAGDAVCTNLVAEIRNEDEFTSPNAIKVVFDRDWRALYFSRSPVPSPELDGFGDGPAFKQVCVFGFTRDALLEFAELEPTPLEAAESIDMLRYLEHNRPVHFVRTDEVTYAVDVPSDVERVERALARSRA
jgi:3-deoxy-manno-octulosonate cytidylyltransferase (CMP-KDO synthetase)